MGQTYLNQVVDKEVSIAVEQILIAPFPTAWTPAIVSDATDAPPLGFRNLGAVVEDSVTLTVTREKFQLSTGIPKNLQFEAIMGITGTIEASLIARRGRFAGFAFGNVLPINMFGTSLSETIAAIVDQTSLTLNDTPGTTIWTIGDLVVTAATTEGLLTSENDAYVSSINGLTVIFSPTFAATPAVDDQAQVVTGIRNPFGTSAIRQFHVLGVADFIDNIQIVHDFPKCTASGDWTEEFRPDQEARIPIKFEALGQTTTTYDNSASHLIVGERFWFNSV